MSHAYTQLDGDLHASFGYTGECIASNILADRLAKLEAAGVLDGAFLDLFAGSGAAGIEALSRGASSATFIERDGKLLTPPLARGLTEQVLGHGCR